MLRYVKIPITNNILLLLTTNTNIKYYILLLLCFYIDQRKKIPQTLPELPGQKTNQELHFTKEETSTNS